MSMNTEILDAKVEFVVQSLIQPLVLSTGSISEVTEAIATVTVRVDGKEAIGRGSIYLSDLWSWPDPAYTHEQRDKILRDLCEDIAANLWKYCGAEAHHPLELGMRMHESVCHEQTPPVLARAMCASPFDAAIHDAVGIAIGKSAFHFYDEPVALPSVDSYFEGNDACGAIAKIITKPKRDLKAWIIVGKNDSP